jgi:hypothetical protein
MNKAGYYKLKPFYINKQSGQKPLESLFEKYGLSSPELNIFLKKGYL